MIKVQCLGSTECPPPDIFKFFNSKGAVRRAGFVPYQIRDGKVVFILGVWPDKPVIADFGGSCNRSETTLDCAIRETTEESLGLINISKEDLKNITNVIITGKPSRKQILIFIRMERLSNNIEEMYNIEKKSQKLLEVGKIVRINSEDVGNGKYKLCKSLTSAYSFFHILKFI